MAASATQRTDARGAGRREAASERPTGTRDDNDISRDVSERVVPTERAFAISSKRALSEVAWQLGRASRQPFCFLVSGFSFARTSEAAPTTRRSGSPGAPVRFRGELPTRGGHRPRSEARTRLPARGSERERPGRPAPSFPNRHHFAFASIMSSRYQKGFTIPDGFPQILKSFTREVRRAAVARRRPPVARGAAARPPRRDPEFFSPLRSSASLTEPFSGVRRLRLPPAARDADPPVAAGQHLPVRRGVLRGQDRGEREGARAARARGERPGE